MRRLVVATVLLLGACSWSPPITRAVAQRAFCADLASAGPSDQRLPEPVVRRLLVDADLFEWAGDGRTAEGIRRLVEGLRLLDRLRRDRKAMAVYLEDGLTDSQLDAIRQSLSEAPEVASVRFESKADALARFRQLFADQPGLVSNVPEDALPASFRVRLSSSESFDELARSIESMPGVERVIVDVSELGDVLEPVLDQFLAGPSVLPRCLRPFVSPPIPRP